MRVTVLSESFLRFKKMNDYSLISINLLQEN